MKLEWCDSGWWSVYLMVSNLFTKEVDSNAWCIIISTSTNYGYKIYIINCNIRKVITSYMYKLWTFCFMADFIILVQMFPSQHFIDLSQKNLEEDMSYFVRGEVGLLFRSQFDNWNHRVYSASGSIMFTFTSSFCREKSSSNFQAVAYFSLSPSLSLNFLSISN